MKTIVVCALALAAALLSIAGTARAAWIRSHGLACYDRADLELVAKYYRPGILNVREGCFSPPEGVEVSVLHYADTDLPVRHFAFVQPKTGGRPFGVTEPSLTPVVEPRPQPPSGKGEGR